MKYFLLRASYAFYIHGVIQLIVGIILSKEVWAGLFMFDAVVVANIFLCLMIVFYETDYLDRYIKKHVIRYAYLVLAIIYNITHNSIIIMYADIEIEELIMKRPIVTTSLYVGILFVCLILFVSSDRVATKNSVIQVK